MLGVTGATTMTSATGSTTFGVTGAMTLANATCSGTLGVTGATTLSTATCSGTLGVTGKTTMTSATCSTTLGVTGATNLGGALTCTGAATFNSDVTVNGTLNAIGMVWMTGRVGSTGTPLSGEGAAGSYTVARAASQPAGVWRITFPTHPNGNGNYTINVTGIGMFAFVRYTLNPPTSTYFEVVCYNTSMVLTDTPFSFMVLNW